MHYVVMALQDFFRIHTFDARVHQNPALRTPPISAEKLIALRNFKNDYLEYNQVGNTDLNYIQISLDRPFRQVYFDIPTPPNLPNVGRSEFFYLQGPGYTVRPFDQTNSDDETAILRQSGFFKITQIPEDWGRDSNGLYSILIWCAREDVSLGDTDWQLPIRGINYIFSDDNDLERLRSDIMEFSKGKGWGPKHVQARDFIMQQLRIMFKNKDLSAFDILNPWELREASAYMALANIYKYELSKLAGDIFDTQAEELYMKARKSFSTVDLSIDTNRDGSLTSSDTDLDATDVVSTAAIKWT